MTPLIEVFRIEKRTQRTKRRDDETRDLKDWAVNRGPFATGDGWNTALSNMRGPGADGITDGLWTDDDSHQRAADNYSEWRSNRDAFPSDNYVCGLKHWAAVSRWILPDADRWREMGYVVRRYRVPFHACRFGDSQVLFDATLAARVSDEPF